MDKSANDKLQTWCEKVATLGVDMLLQNNLVKRDDFDLAVKLVAEEIRIRLLMRDRPPPDAREIAVDDAAVAAQKNELDRQLATLGRDDNILFGPSLFAAFQQRGWFTLEKFGDLPSEPKYTAYAGKYFVFPTTDVPDLEFRIRRWGTQNA
jgi:hypothetical protein